MQSPPADTEPRPDLTHPLECGAEARTRVHKSVCLFGGLKGAPVPSMERYAEALCQELLALGWPARLVRGKARLMSGSRAARFVAFELSNRVLYPRSARRERADVFHITDHSFAHLVTALPRDRTVVTCHDLMPWMVPEIFSRRLGRTVGLPLWERSVRAMTRAAHIVCDSTRTMQDVRERLGVPVDRISVVPLAAGDAFVHLGPAERQAARERFGLPPDACLVIHTGSSAAYKNVEAVIRTAHTLRARGVPAWFLKVGPITGDQRALIGELALSDGFQQWTGITDDALCSVYNAADVMLFPSLYEGFGLPPLEAMKAGVPVVISSTEALVETTGGLVPAVDARDFRAMADAVQDIWERRSSRDADTYAARKYAEAFTWKRTAAAMAAVYDRISRNAIGGGA